jgi:hypothetical protein
MAKIDWSKFPVVPGFDALQTKWDIQAQIRRETEGMTKEEIREYYRKSSEELRIEREQFQAEQEAIYDKN